MNTFFNIKSKLQEKKIKFIYLNKEIENILVIYKNTKRETYYLIIYKTEININLPYTILNICITIIQRWKSRNVKEYPLIIPIVICFKNKINIFCNKNTNKYIVGSKFYKNSIDLKYNLISIDEFYNKKIIKDTIIEELIYIEMLKNVDK